MSTSPLAIPSVVRDALVPRRVVLAVSGGIDSMVLLDACARVAADRVACVATFDHGTGPTARAAAALVVEVARAHGFACEVGHAALAGATEAEWRDARWRFLRAVRESRGATAVATAHTRDDRVETVVLRILRGAGARGLAALEARAPGIVRPLAEVGRPDVAAHAAANGVRWIEDPGNASRRHLRNRVRLDLLPTLSRVRPSLDGDLLALARRAAELRADVEAFIDAHVPTRRGADGALHVAAGALAGYDAESLATLWPAIAARVGVRLDRRGTERLSQFTMQIAAGAAGGAGIQLSGPVHVEAYRGEIVIWPSGTRAAVARPAAAAGECVTLAGSLSFDGWRFAPVERADARDPWAAALPASARLTVRAWQPGDRMRTSGGGAARRVKRFLADARVRGRDRAGWPVVLAGDEIVWIPGVRRSDAATDRPDRPGVHYICERNR